MISSVIHISNIFFLIILNISHFIILVLVLIYIILIPVISPPLPYDPNPQSSSNDILPFSVQDSLSFALETKFMRVVGELLEEEAVTMSWARRIISFGGLTMKHCRCYLETKRSTYYYYHVNSRSWYGESVCTSEI